MRSLDTISEQQGTIYAVISTCLQSARWKSERGSCPAGTLSDGRPQWPRSCDRSGSGSRRPWSLLRTSSGQSVELVVEKSVE